MSITHVFSLLGGLALFLYGMDLMGKSLERQAGSRLQKILSRLTENPFKGFLLGLAVTAVMALSTAASCSCTRPSASSWAATWAPPSPAGCSA